MQKDLREQRMGPRSKGCVDAAGNPTPAALGFAKMPEFRLRINSGLQLRPKVNI